MPKILGRSTSVVEGVEKEKLKSYMVRMEKEEISNQPDIHNSSLQHWVRK